MIDIRKFCDDLLALAEKATPGPWTADALDGCDVREQEHEPCGAIRHSQTVIINAHTDADAIFTAAARTALPNALKMILAGLDTIYNKPGTISPIVAEAMQRVLDEAERGK